MNGSLWSCFWSGLGSTSWKFAETFDTFTGTEASEATVCRFLQKVGFTHTKIQHVARQWNEEWRARYLAEMQQHESDSMRKFGYSLRGRCTKSQKLLIRGRSISAISALPMNGTLDFSQVVWWC